MKRLAQLSSPVALATGLLSAAASVALAIRGPISELDLALTVTAVAFVSTTLVGMAVLRTSPANPVGWILLVAGAALPLGMFVQVVSDASYIYGRPTIPGLVVINLVGGVLAVFAVPLVGLFGLLLFPDGRLAASGTSILRRTRWLARACWIMLAGLVAGNLFSPSLPDVSANAPRNPIGVPGGGILIIFVLALGPLMAMTCAHLFGRARAADTPDQRRALTLAATAGACIPAAFLACLGVGITGGDTAQIGVIENLGAVAVAVACWYGIIRYGLFDSRAVLSRTLLYGALTVVVVAVYLAASTLLGRLFAGDVPAVVAAGLAALAVLPLRDLLQRRVSRLVYGLRDEPVAAFGLLRVRLDAAAAPEEVLPAVVRTVGEALRLRCVVIEVGGEETARWGQAVDGTRLELEEAERAVADIRRIAYNLRPPVLDEMGLVGAIRDHATRLGGATVTVPAPLPPLPAAVEVAVYRIAVEAMTNACRHAPGAPIEVSLSVNGHLELLVTDAGAGLPPGFRAGVGLRSMRERAAELGGECVLNPRDPHGTVVRASLPLEAVPS